MTQTIPVDISMVGHQEWQRAKPDNERVACGGRTQPRHPCCGSNGESRASVCSSVLEAEGKKGVAI